MSDRDIRVNFLHHHPPARMASGPISGPVPQLQLTAMSAAQVAVMEYQPVGCFEKLADFRRCRPDLRVIVTGRGLHNATVLRAIAYGAKGYVDSFAPRTELVRAIRAVHGGLIWAPRKIIAMFVDGWGELIRKRDIDCCNLTLREKQVLSVLIEGRSNKEIGILLGINERTVKAHLTRLMRKMGAKNRVTLSMQATVHPFEQ